MFKPFLHTVNTYYIVAGDQILGTVGTTATVWSDTAAFEWHHMFWRPKSIFCMYSPTTYRAN